MANAPTPNDLTRQQLDELDSLLQRMLALPLNKPDDLPPAPTSPRSAAAFPPPATDTPPKVMDLPPDWRADAPTSMAARPPYFAGFETDLEPVAVAPQPEYAAPSAFLPSPAPKPAAARRPEPSDLPDLPPRFFAPPTPDTGAPPLPTPPAVTGFDYGPVALTPPAADELPPLALAELPPAVEAVATEASAAEPPAPLEPTPFTPPATGRGVPSAHWPLFASNWVLEQALALCGPPGRALASAPGKTVLGGAGLLMLVAAGAWAAMSVGLVPTPDGLVK